MTKEERRKYIFAQLNSLPNAYQYIEVRQYIESLEQQLKKKDEVIDKLSIIIYEIKDYIETAGGYPSEYIDNLLQILEDKEVE